MSDEDPDVTLVKVYETGNAAVIPVVESVLDDAGIEYMATSEGVQDLFGWGRFGTNYSVAVGPVQFFVRKDDEDEARSLMETIDHDGVPEGDDQDSSAVGP